MGNNTSDIITLTVCSLMAGTVSVKPEAMCGKIWFDTVDDCRLSMKFSSCSVCVRELVKCVCERERES